MGRATFGQLLIHSTREEELAQVVFRMMITETVEDDILKPVGVVPTREDICL